MPRARTLIYCLTGCRNGTITGQDSSPLPCLDQRSPSESPRAKALSLQSHRAGSSCFGQRKPACVCRPLSEHITTTVTARPDLKAALSARAQVPHIRIRDLAICMSLASTTYRKHSEEMQTKSICCRSNIHDLDVAVATRAAQCFSFEQPFETHTVLVETLQRPKMSDDSRRNSSEEASKSAAVEDPPKDQGVAPTAASAERPGVLEDIFTEIARLVELTPRKYRKVANREGLVMLTAATMHMEDLIVNNHHLRAESRTTDLQIQALQRRVQYLVQQNAHLVGTIEGLGFSYEEENRDSDLAPFWYGFLPGLDRPDVVSHSPLLRLLLVSASLPQHRLTFNLFRETNRAVGTTPPTAEGNCAGRLGSPTLQTSSPASPLLRMELKAARPNSNQGLHSASCLIFWMEERRTARRATTRKPRLARRRMAMRTDGET